MKFGYTDEKIDGETQKEKDATRSNESKAKASASPSALEGGVWKTTQSAHTLPSAQR